MLRFTLSTIIETFSKIDPEKIDIPILVLSKWMVSLG